MIGETQVREFGELETPILLTCTLCVWSAANALKEWVYTQPAWGSTPSILSSAKRTTVASIICGLILFRRTGFQRAVESQQRCCR